MSNINFSDLNSTQIEAQELSNVNLSVQEKIQGGITLTCDGYRIFIPRPSNTSPSKPSKPSRPISTFPNPDISNFNQGYPCGIWKQKH